MTLVDIFKYVLLPQILTQIDTKSDQNNIDKKLK